MTAEYKTIAQAKADKKGSIIAKLVSLGELTSGTKKDGGTWQKQTGVLKDNSEAMEITFWGEDIGKMEPGKYYFLENPFWSEYKDKTQLSLGKFAIVAEATEANLIKVDGHKTMDAPKPEPTNDEYLKKKQQEILANMPTGTELELIQNEIKKLQKIEAVVSKELGADSAQKIGMFTKLIYERMQKI